jgi:hypothetical protein
MGIKALESLILQGALKFAFLFDARDVSKDTKGFRILSLSMWHGCRKV